MSQTSPLIDTLKRELRKRRITYKTVSQTLGLSETSVKRLFCEQSFSLKRLEKVCALLQLEISDLVHLMEKNVEFTLQLTRDQEKELVSDIKLLLMAHLCMNGSSPGEIRRDYVISESESARLLERLSQMGLIEKPTDERVGLAVSPNFNWIPGGPVERFFEQRMQREFLNAGFDGPGELRLFVSAMISRDANADMIEKMHDLAREMNAKNDDAEALSRERRVGTSLMLAIRPWEIDEFRALRRGTARREID